MLVVVGVLPLAHEVLHYQPYPPVVVVVLLLMTDRTEQLRKLGKVNTT